MAVLIFWSWVIYFQYETCLNLITQTKYWFGFILLLLVIFTWNWFPIIFRYFNFSSYCLYFDISFSVAFFFPVCFFFCFFVKKYFLKKSTLYISISVKRYTYPCKSIGLPLKIKFFTKRRILRRRHPYSNRRLFVKFCDVENIKQIFSVLTNPLKCHSGCP